jgi:hypothetical protein
VTLKLAHILSGGSGIEQYALALGVIALGAAFLIQKTVDKKVSIGLVIVGAALLVASFTVLKSSGGGGSITVAGTSYPVSDFENAAAGLCAAQDQATEDFRTAQVTFLNRSHGPLHVIAAAIEDEDRAQTATLLETKREVEQDIIDKVDGEELARDLGRLAGVTRRSLRVMNISVPPC